MEGEVVFEDLIEQGSSIFYIIAAPYKFFVIGYNNNNPNNGNVFFCNNRCQNNMEEMVRENAEQNCEEPQLAQWIVQQIFICVFKVYFKLAILLCFYRYNLSGIITYLFFIVPIVFQFMYVIYQSRILVRLEPQRNLWCSLFFAKFTV